MGRRDRVSGFAALNWEKAGKGIDVRKKKRKSKGKKVILGFWFVRGFAGKFRQRSLTGIVKWIHYKL